MWWILGGKFSVNFPQGNWKKIYHPKLDRVLHFQKEILVLGLAPPRTGSPGPSGPEPRKSPKRVPKEPPGRDPQSPERVRPESQKSPKRVKNQTFGLFRTHLRLRGALFWDFGVSRPGGLFRDPFSDSSGVPGPKGPGDPVRAGPILILVLELALGASSPKRDPFSKNPLSIVPIAWTETAQW